jgi:hypothetical protein
MTIGDLGYTRFAKRVQIDWRMHVFWSSSKDVRWRLGGSGEYSSGQDAIDNHLRRSISLLREAREDGNQEECM